MKIECKSTGEVVYSYNDYLKTEHWKNMRQEYMLSLKGEGKCKVCFSKKDLNVHHKTYYGIGQEAFGDFMLLCRECHHALHGIMKRMEENDAFHRDQKYTKIYQAGKDMRKEATAQVQAKAHGKEARRVIVRKKAVSR